jgi:protein TonB
MLALIVHMLLAGVELDIFKRPVQVGGVPSTLTVNLIQPVEKEKGKPPARDTRPRKKVIQKSNPKRLTPRLEPKPTLIKKRDTAKIADKPLAPEKKVPHKPPVPIFLPSPGISPEKKEQPDSKREYAFIPGVADIPTGKPKRGNLPHAEEQDRHVSLDETTTVAAPNYKENHAPKYPLVARRRNYEGTVLLDVLVSKKGMVDSIRLAESSGHQVLDRAAVKAVRAWAFHPGKKGDEPVAMWVTVPVRFQLE